MSDIALDYSDIVLVPQYSEVKSRRGVDTWVRLGKHHFALPVVPSNMPPVISLPLAKKLAKAGYFYIMHRFDEEPYEVLEFCQEHDIYSSISIGMQGADWRELKEIRSVVGSIDYITIDVAHGHHKMMQKAIDFCNDLFPDSFIIAGNVGTPEAVLDLHGWGADAVKVGIAPGLACATYEKTGFMTPMFSTVLECAKTGVAIIADGGIRSDGDIAKALAAGATMVMVGSQLAGYLDSPGAVYHDDDGIPVSYEFYGSASERNGDKTAYIEGKTTVLPYHAQESVLDRLYTMRESLQSAVSYAGGKSIEDLRGTPWKRISR